MAAPTLLPIAGLLNTPAVFDRLRAVWQGRSRIVVGASEAIAASAQNAEIDRVPDAGHLLPLEHPQAMARSLERLEQRATMPPRQETA
jgi:pimeloyl-ACP methyl ester carboxylesterase